MSNSESDYSSSSEEDEDYVPSGEDESGDELEGVVDEDGLEDVSASIHNKKKTKGKREDALSRKRKKWMALEDQDGNKDEPPEDKERIELEKALREETERKKEEEQKKKADDLWSSFLSDVKQKPKPKPSQAQDAQPKKPMPSNKTADDHVKSPPQTANSSQSNGNKPSSTVKITKVFDFAGEEVKVTKEVKATSREAKNFFKQQEEKTKETASGSGAGPSALTAKLGAPPGLKRPGGGLGSVLGQIGKKQKISTLEKSKLDWMNFKQAEGIEEELKIHNKGKEGYVEKQKFLQRTDVKQYEIERDLRLSQTKILR